MVTAELLDLVLGALEDEIYKSLEYNPPPETLKKNLRSFAHSRTLSFLASLPDIRDLLATLLIQVAGGQPMADGVYAGSEAVSVGSRPNRSIPMVLPRSISPRRYFKSSLSPLCPMMTRLRSTRCNWVP